MDEDLWFTDLHCHLLPGIDDGPRNWDGSLALARLAAAEGICTIVATPHQLGGYEGNTCENIRDLTMEAQDRINKAGLDLSILPGADVRIQEDLALLVRENRVVTLADRHAHLLLELPHGQVLPLGNLIHQLNRQGVDCILSHPERNDYLQHHPEVLRPWVQQGCLVQVTSGSITGQFGPKARALCRWLFRENMVHVVATDAHDARRRPPLLRQAFQTVCRWVGVARAKKVFVENPKAVIVGKAVDAPLPVVRGGVGWWWKTAFAAHGY